MKMMTKFTLFILFGLAPALAQGLGQEVTLNFVPSETTVGFTLGDVLHSVHGIFSLRSGQIHFDPANNAIIVDAASGNSGSAARDQKMNKEILDSAGYSEVSFQPDRVEGKVLSPGTSTVQVHGMFRIHGAEHEITVPAQIELTPDHWNLTVHFMVPYVKWGMKDPSTFILRVQKTVGIELHAQGPSPWITRD